MSTVKTFFEVVLATLRQKYPVDDRRKADRLVHLADLEQTIETVRQLDGATAAGSSCGANCTLYPSPKGTPVETFIHPGAHVFPPAATGLIVQFFQQHPLNP